MQTSDLQTLNAIARASFATRLLFEQIIRKPKLAPQYFNRGYCFRSTSHPTMTVTQESLDARGV